VVVGDDRIGDRIHDDDQYTRTIRINGQLDLPPALVFHPYLPLSMSWTTSYSANALEVANHTLSKGTFAEEQRV
jgi:hypothetical protein